MTETEVRDDRKRMEMDSEGGQWRCQGECENEKGRGTIQGTESGAFGDDGRRKLAEKKADKRRRQAEREDEQERAVRLRKDSENKAKQRQYRALQGSELDRRRYIADMKWVSRQQLINNEDEQQRSIRLRTNAERERNRRLQQAGSEEEQERFIRLRKNAEREHNRRLQQAGSEDEQERSIRLRKNADREHIRRLQQAGSDDDQERSFRLRKNADREHNRRLQRARSEDEQERVLRRRINADREADRRRKQPGELARSRNDTNEDGNGGCQLPQPITDSAHRMIEDRIASFYHEDNLVQEACCVCDEDVLRRLFTIVELPTARSWLTRFQLRLRWRDDIELVPLEVKAQYTLKSICPQLCGLALSQRGVCSRSDDGRIKVRVCRSCSTSLRRGRIDSRDAKPPARAIANGWAQDQLPQDLQSSSWAELRMVAPATISTLVRLVGRRNDRQQLLAHTISIVAAPGPPIMLLPRWPDRADITVLFANVNSQERAMEERQTVRVRREQIDKLFSYGRKVSLAFAGLRMDQDLMASLPDDGTLDHLITTDDTGETIAIGDIEEDADRVGTTRPTTSFNAAPHESSSGLFELGQSCARPDILHNVRVTNSSVLLSERDPLYWAKAFWHLFPRNTGTPSSPRAVHVAEPDAIDHLMRLSTHQFQNDPSFGLTAFDRIARRIAQQSLNVRLYSDADIASDAVSLSVDSVEQLLRFEEACRKAATSGRARPPTPEVLLDGRARRVMRAIDTAAGHSFGTRQERERMRLIVYGYCGEFGRPAMMVTVTPNDRNNFTIAVRSGLKAVIPGQAVTIEDYRRGLPLPSQDCIQQATGRSPWQSALYFDQFCEFFFSQIVGWDHARGEPTEQGGLFGQRPLAYTAGVETQGSTTLHFHALIWLGEFPRVAIPDGTSAASDFNAALVRYADSILTSTVSAFRFFIEPSPHTPDRPHRFRCPACFDSFLDEAPLLPILRTSAVRFAPKIASCPGCAVKYTNKELREKCCQELARVANVDFTEIRAGVADLLSRPAPFPMPPLIGDDAQDYIRRSLRIGNQVEVPSPHIQTHISRTIELTFAVAKVQEHLVCHHGSCFKKGKQRRRLKCQWCRYGKPDERCPFTIVGRDLAEGVRDDEVHIQRLLGSEYMTPVSTDLFSLALSNADIKLLRGSSIDYTVKYTVKPQEIVDSQTLVDLVMKDITRSLTRRLSVEANSPNMTMSEAGRARVRSLLWHLTNRIEVASTMACLYIIRQQMALFQSHETAGLFLNAGLAVMNGDEHRIHLKLDDKQERYTGVNVFADVLYRPAELRDLSWYDFVRQYRVVPRRRARSTSSAIERPDDFGNSNEPHESARTRFRFLPQHGQFEKKEVIKRGANAIAVIYGPTLKPRCRRESPDDDDRFGQAMYLMHVPLPETPSVLLAYVHQIGGWGNAWRAANDEDRVSATGLRFVQHHEDRWATLLRSQELAEDYYARLAVQEDSIDTHSIPTTGERRSTRTDSDDDPSSQDVGDSVGSLAELLWGTETDRSESLRQDDDIASDEKDFTGTDKGPLTTAELPFRDQVVNVPSIQLPVDCAGANPDEIRSGLEKARVELTAAITTAVLEAEIEGSTFPARSLSVVEMNDLFPSAIAAQPETTQHAELRRKLFETTELRSVPFSFDAKSAPTELQPFASLSEISKLASLTEKQNDAFTLIGRSLLRYLQYDARGLLMDRQALIDQQRMLLLYGLGGSGKSRVIRAWHALSISWGAPDATARFAIAGVAAINVDGATLASVVTGFDPSRPKISDRLRQMYMPAKVVILDEIGMVPASTLYTLSQWLQCLHDNDLMFGGINIVLCGDFSQLPPVRANFMFERQRSQSSRLGAALYKTIRDSATVHLVDNMRTSFTEYAQLQQQVREGNWTKEVWETWQNRVAQPPTASPAPSNATNREPDYCPIAVVRNSTRLAMGNAFAREMAKTLLLSNLPRPILLLADVKAVGRGKQHCLSETALRYIVNLSDDKFDRMPIVFHAYLGAYVLISHTISIAHRLGNGTRGRIVGWRFPPGTTFRNEEHDEVQVQVPVDSNSGSPSPIEYLLVEITSTTITRPLPLQPPGLPPNVIALPRQTINVQKAISVPCTVSGRRRSVKLQITQVPCRQANVVTTYSIQGNEYDRYVIGETDAKSFYVQCSRGRFGLGSVGIACPLSQSLRQRCSPSQALIDEIKAIDLADQDTAFRLEAETTRFGEDTLLA